MSYIWYKTELQLTDFQKQVIDYGIKLQRDMWNFLVEDINSIVDNKDICIQTSTTQLQKLLLECFYEEFKKSGLGTRMIRSIVDRYIKAWKNYFNKNMKQQGKPRFHSCKKSTQSLSFCDVEGGIIGNTYQLPLYRKDTFGIKNHIKKPQVQLKVIENSTKYLSKYESLIPKNSTIIRRKNRYFLCINYECTYKKMFQ